MSGSGMNIFERYLSLWVALCIITGVAVGYFFPGFPRFFSRLEYEHVSIPIAVLIWLMIFPMMLKVDFSAILKHVKVPKGLTITLVSNWLIKPFSMFFISSFFFFFVFKRFIPNELGREYLAGAVLLGAAPCTAMVFVWSYLTNGNPAYTVLQVAVNDLVLLFLFAPIVAFLLGISNIQVPYSTLILSVILFVVVPLGLGIVVRKKVIQSKGAEYFNGVFLKKFSGITVTGLLLTLVLIFSFQGKIILQNPLHIVLISIPLILQTFIIFFIGYIWAMLWKVPHDIAAPAGIIGASNFFELAVAVAISLFGLDSGAVLATVVGVMVEVPVMLTVVKIANKTKIWFQ